MSPFHYIGIGIAVAALGAYTMALQGAILHWGARLAGGPTEEDLVREQLSQGASLPEARGYAMRAALANRGFQDAITPKAQKVRLILFNIGMLAMLVVGVIFFRWYWGLLGLFGTFVSTSMMQTLFPGADSAFYRDILLSNLKQRQLAYTATGDFVRAEACAELIGRFHSTASL